MALSSMTGFARGHGVAGAYAWGWEIKSVNAKGLDLRLRLPPGWDAVEVPARTRAHRKAFARHRLCQSHRRAQRRAADGEGQRAGARRGACDAQVACRQDRRRAAERSTAFLSLKGVIEVTDDDESEDERRAAESAIARRLRHRRWPTLIAMRRAEGATLGRLLSARLDEIAALAARAEAAPGRKPEAIKARLAEQVATLLSASRALRSATGCTRKRSCSPAKADIREELDRLASHVAQAQKLLADGGPSAASSISWRRNSTANRIR